jgi:CheY-like chemotaxis protein
VSELRPILVVEDEAIIQMMITTILGDLGFSVLEAATGEEAFRILDDVGGRLGALVTDIRLGRSKSSGWDVACRARELSQNVPVLYITGDSAAAWRSHGVPLSVLILKPFAESQIVTAISRLLDNAG